MNALMLWAIGGVGTAFISPALLGAMVRRGVDASRVLSVWAALVSASVVLIALPALGEVVHSCWLVLHDGQPTRLDAVIALLSAGVLAVAAIRAGWRLRRATAGRCSLHEHHIGLARILDGADPAAGTVLWLPIPHALAYSIAGNPPLIVASTALRERLDTGALTAVLAHEKAHLVRRHHFLVAVACVVAAAFPWLPLMSRSPRLIATLVELDADAHAARACGAGGLRRALQTLQPTAAPAHALAITGDDTALRLARLSHSPARRLRPVRAALTPAAATLAIVAPMFAIAVILSVTALTSCATV